MVKIAQKSPLYTRVNCQQQIEGNWDQTDVGQTLYYESCCEIVSDLHLKEDVILLIYQI